MIDDVKIVETKKYSIKNSIIVEGFPGIGLVGTVAASYLVEKLKMEQVGYVTSRAFPPLAAVHNYLPMHPARVYASPSKRIIVILSEFVIPMIKVRNLAEVIFEYAKEKKAREIISLGGITIKGEQDTVYAIASTPSLVKRLSQIKGVSVIKEGATTGVAAVLLSIGAGLGYPVSSLLAEAHAEFMDPKGAAMVIEALNKLVGINVDTSELEREATEIQDKMKELIEKAKSVHNKYKEAEGKDYGIGSMYG
ncbi:MAG: PAC2 family protein [Candidatus Anstonellales archaeon]